MIEFGSWWIGFWCAIAVVVLARGAFEFVWWIRNKQ